MIIDDDVYAVLIQQPIFEWHSSFNPRFIHLSGSAPRLFTQAEIHTTLKNIGVDPSALYKGSSTPIHIADVKEDCKWVTLKVKVVQIWDNTSYKITQTGIIGDETCIIKFIIWESANLPLMKEGRSYEIKSKVTSRFILFRE